MFGPVTLHQYFKVLPQHVTLHKAPHKCYKHEHFVPDLYTRLEYFASLFSKNIHVAI